MGAGQGQCQRRPTSRPYFPCVCPGQGCRKRTKSHQPKRRCVVFEEGKGVGRPVCPIRGAGGAVQDPNRTRSTDNQSLADACGRRMPAIRPFRGADRPCSPEHSCLSESRQSRSTRCVVRDGGGYSFQRRPAKVVRAWGPAAPPGFSDPARFNEAAKAVRKGRLFCCLLAGHAPQPAFPPSQNRPTRRAWSGIGGQQERAQARGVVCRHLPTIVIRPIPTPGAPPGDASLRRRS